jgi:hypothetical protein
VFVSLLVQPEQVVLGRTFPRVFLSTDHTLIKLELQFRDRLLKCSFLLLQRVQNGFLVLKLEFRFLQLRLDLNELGMSVGMCSLRLLVPLDPYFTSVFFTDKLLLILRNLISHLDPLDFELFFKRFFLRIRRLQVPFSINAS